MTTEITLDGLFDGTGGDPEVKRLRSTHPLWDKYAPLWDFYLAAFEGGKAFANGENIHQHARENDEDYEERVKRLDNTNYCEPLCSYFTNFIFAETIDRNGASNADFYNDFVADVSLRGERVDDFMRQVCDDAQIFGMSHVLTDAPSAPQDRSFSRQAEVDNNIRPYWVLIQPCEITDWVKDKFGKFLYAKRKECCEAVVSGKRAQLETYTEFYEDRYVVSTVNVTRDEKPVIISAIETPNLLGKVPLKTAYYRRSKIDPEMGVSFLADFADNNKKILNLSSLLDEFLFKQCFNVLAKETESGVPLREQEEGVLGTSNVMEVPKGAAMPKYISPPVDPAKVIQDERSRIIKEMFMRASQEMQNELSNGEKSSGFSQSQSFSKTVPFIASRADMLERLETELMQLTMEIMGKKWDGKIKYKDRYELTNLTSALTQLQVIVKDFQIPSKTFVVNELKRIVHEYDGKLSVQDQATVDKEIEDMDFEAWMADQKTAFIGAPQTSPGAQQQPKKDATLITTENGGGGVNTKATVKLQD